MKTTVEKINLAASFLTGIVGAILLWLWANGTLPGIAGCLGAVSGVLATVLAITALKESAARNIQLKKLRDELSAASAKAEAAIRGRRLSKEQKAAITAAIKGLDFGQRREVAVRYVKGATEAREFAHDIAALLRTLSFHCGEIPHEVPKYDQLEHTTGTIIQVRGLPMSSATQAFKDLANAFATHVAEAKFTGGDSMNEPMRIIVGHPK